MQYRYLLQSIGQGQRHRRLSTWSTLVLLISGAALLLFACSGAEKKVTQSDAELLQQGEEALAKKDYEKAQTLFKQLMSQYPASEWIPRAQLNLARAYYEDEKYVEAKAEYQKFLDLHPRHPQADEAHYYLGLTHFAELNSKDRDPMTAQRAVTEFQTVLRDAPDSRFAADAKERIGVCQLRMAEHEYFVGRFYFRKGKYRAASWRFQYLISHYPGTRMEEKALYYLGESLYKLKEGEAAGSAFQQLMDRFPNTEYGGKVRGRLEAIKSL